jgi:hypothetical protein
VCLLSLGLVVGVNIMTMFVVKNVIYINKQV